MNKQRKECYLIDGRFRVAKPLKGKFIWFPKFEIWECDRWKQYALWIGKIVIIRTYTKVT